MTDQRLESLNKAYLVGEYDLKRYRELREELIDEFTNSTPGGCSSDRLTDEDDSTKEYVSEPTLKITEPPKPPKIKASALGHVNSSIEAEKHHRGPSFLQFLWVSIAILLFVYMYTASID